MRPGYLTLSSLLLQPARPPTVRAGKQHNITSLRHKREFRRNSHEKNLVWVAAVVFMAGPQRISPVLTEQNVRRHSSVWDRTGWHGSHTTSTQHRTPQPQTTTATAVQRGAGFLRAGGNVIVSESDVKNLPTNPHSGEEKLFWKYTISGNMVTTKGKMSHEKKRKNEAGLFYFPPPHGQMELKTVRKVYVWSVNVSVSFTSRKSTRLKLCYLTKKADGCRFKGLRMLTCIFLSPKEPRLALQKFAPVLCDVHWEKKPVAKRDNFHPHISVARQVH